MDIEYLKYKAKQIRKKTLELNKISKNLRIASSLSLVEIYVYMFYTGLLSSFQDRIVISKGHGGVSLYPILADLGFFEEKELSNISKNGSLLCDIPNATIPGFDVIFGSLGHGAGVACGLGLAYKKKNKPGDIYCILGDGELNEGSVWEAFFFAAHHKLNNITFIVDMNKKCMLGKCDDILNINKTGFCYPGLPDKILSLGCFHFEFDGHNFWEINNGFLGKTNIPKIMIANTIKGKGCDILENDDLCHIRTLKDEEVDEAIEKI